MANYQSTHTGAQIDGAITKVEGVASLTNGNLLAKKSDGGFAAATSANVTTALGYTPYNSTNPSGYQTSSQVDAKIAAAISDAIAASY